MILDEIRINNRYSTHYISEYKHGEEDESVPVVNKRNIRTSELIQKIKTNVKFESEYRVDHLFPPNCRYYERHKGGHLVVIEEPPAFRTIAVDKDMVRELESLKNTRKLEEYGYENWENENKVRPYMFNLALPYSIFFLAFDSNFGVLGCLFFFRSHPISGFSDSLCKAPFLNINENQAVCFGDHIHRGPRRSIFADVSYAIKVFWSTIFNPDYIYNYVEYQNVAGLRDYLTWQYFSQKDPMFVYNADWIHYNKLNVGQAIEKIRYWLFANKNNYSKILDYNILSNLFNEQSQRQLEYIQGIGIEEPLLYDVCQSLFVGDTSINIGDSFKVKNGQYFFVDSFLGFRKMPNALYINIEREDGRIFRMKLTQKVKNYILSKILEERYEAKVELENGVVLKPDSIIIMKNRYNQNIYRRVHYLRKNPNGDVEGRFGSEFYIIKNLPNDISVVDVDNLTYMGVKLQRNNTYFVLHGNDNDIAVGGAMCKFDTISSDKRNSIMMVFKTIDRENDNKVLTIDFNNNSKQKVFDIKGFRKLPIVFRLGQNLVYSSYPSYSRYDDHTIVDTYVIPESGVAHKYNSKIKLANYNMFEGKLIQNNRLKIESWDTDIEFTVGDKVVISNWENPIDMLTIKQIEGFVENKETGHISIAVVDKNGKVSTHLYVNSRRSLIKVGSIRKITNKWKELSAGMKISANQSGIPMFPKKDYNIIIGFLYDTGGEEPLVLCSNACTLWYSDVITKFNIISLSNKKWKSIKHASINPSKMRIQAGDLIYEHNIDVNNDMYFIHRPMYSRALRIAILNHFSDCQQSYTFNKYFMREAMFDSFPNPRLTNKQEESLGFVNVFPNFHGMYTINHFSEYMVPNDLRSILNVPNNSE